jgi:sialidase-1
MKQIAILLIFSGAFMLSSCTKRATDITDQLEPLDDIIDVPISVIGGGNLITGNKPYKLFEPDLIKGYKGYGFASLIETDKNKLIVTAARYRSFDDFVNADIVARKSTDNGVTWEKEYTIQENIGTINTTAPSLVKISKSHLMLFVCAKTSITESHIYYKESFDGGNTWNQPKRLEVGLKGYYTMANDRVIYNNGRIIYAVGFSPESQSVNHFVFCLYSDDLGRTWKKSPSIRASFSLTEPCVAVINKSELLMCIRSSNGFVYFSQSQNNGATWKSLLKTKIETPEAPQSILQIGGDTLVMAWNNTPYTPGHENRTPLTLAYSTDKGNSWKGAVNLQKDQSFNYFYPTLALSSSDSLLVTYGIRRKATYNPSIYFEKVSIKNLLK